MILGYIAPHLIKENIGLLIQCDMSKEMLAMSKEVPDIEVRCPFIELYPNILPLSISLCMSDLEQLNFIQNPNMWSWVNRILRPRSMNPQKSIKFQNSNVDNKYYIPECRE